MPINSRERSKAEDIPKRKIIRRETDSRSTVNIERKTFAYFPVPLNVPISSS